MSWKYPIRYFFIITLCLITEAFAEKVDPLLLHDLGKLKGISDSYHVQEKPALSKKLKNDHNQLAAEVNGFIESIVMFTDTNISQ